MSGSCCFEDCGDPNCMVCSVPRRFPPVTVRPQDELKRGTKALNGTKKSKKAEIANEISAKPR